jgi:hypothetical protein
MHVVSDDREEEVSARSRSSQVQRSLTNFFAGTAVTGLLLVLVELASFVGMRVLRASVFEETPGKRELAAYKSESWAPALAREEKESRDGYDYKPYTVWRSRPFHGQAVNIEEDGLRRTYHSHCQAKEFTIWLFGGSTMRGNGSPDWGTIPSQLAEMFEQAGQPACVRNFGEGAWVSTQEMTQLMLALKSETRKPNLVIFYDGANDTYVPYQSGKADVHMNFETIKNQFEGQRSVRDGGFGYLLQTNTVQFIFSLVAKSAQHEGDRPVPNSDLEGLAKASVKNYFANMDVVEGLSHQYGFNYAFFWQPVVYTSHKTLAGEEQQIRQSKKLRNLASWVPQMYDEVHGQQRPHFYDLTNTFDQASESLFLDWCHVTMTGNQLIARRIFEVIRPNGS